MAIVHLFGPGEGLRSRTVSSQRRVNLYLEAQADPDASNLVMYSTPGLSLFAALTAALTDTTPRGARGFTARAIIVIGAAVKFIYPSGAVETIGSLNTQTGRVSISDNGSQAMIVDGVAGYLVNLTTGALTTISDTDFPNGATTVTFLNGYFIVNKPNTGQFWWSALYDGSSWNGLDFATAESNPDNLIAVQADHGVLFLMGERTIEYWAASGDTAIWRRVAGSGTEWGVASPWTFDRFGEGQIFMAKNRMGQFQVVVQNGLQIQSITTPDIADSMNRESSVVQATGFSFMFDGHPFYQISWPDKTYLYDGQSQSWQERQSGGSRHYAEIRFEMQAIPYVMDYRYGFIYTQSPDVYTDNGTTILRQWTTKHVETNLDRVTVDNLQVQFQPGTGLVTGQGSDPQAMLEVSRDGGNTWGNEHWVSIGKIGAYLQRAIWRQLGRARDWVFRVSVTDPVRVVIVNAAIKVR